MIRDYTLLFVRHKLQIYIVILLRDQHLLAEGEINTDYLRERAYSVAVKFKIETEMTRDIATLLKMDERNWEMTLSLRNVTAKALKRDDERLATLASYFDVYIIQSVGEDRTIMITWE